MWNRNLEIDVLVGNLINDFNQISRFLSTENINNLFEKSHMTSIISMNNMFPNLSTEDKLKIIEIAYAFYKRESNEKFEIVVTAPVSFNLKARKTYVVMDELIKKSNKSIMITGYSISDYIDDKIEMIINKIRSGIYVEIFVNDIENMEKQLKNIMMYKGKFLKIYNYKKNNEDKMAALHAKVIVSDNKQAIITSSNLSYHGILGNIEMGVLFESKNKCKEIKDIFNKLIKAKIFESV